MNNQSKSQYLDILQVFRGIAALMVVLHHSVGSLRYYHKIDDPLLNYMASIGKFGVDFFFVLSGFIITYSAFFKYNEPKSFSNYIKNRLIRIYVPYLPIGIFMLVVYTLLPGFSNGNRDISLFTSLTLIPQGNPALSVAWTLSFELCFYFLFSISFYSKKVWNCFVFLWFLAIIVFTYTAYSSVSFLKIPFFRILFSTYNLEFILGFILAMLVVRKIQLNKTLLFSLLIFALTSFFFCTFNHQKLFAFDANLLFALVAFLSIFSATSFGNFHINKKSVIMMVGNATYSIYLIHNPLQMILIRLFPKINSTSNALLALVAVLILSSVFGYVYYLIFEEKVMKSVKSKIVK
jgi:exopolysaccharide production protein ExoZ